MRTLVLSGFCVALVACAPTESVVDSSASDAGVTEQNDAALSELVDAPTAPPDAVRPDAGPVRMDPILPTVRGPCDDFSATGTVTLAGEGGTTREANIWVSEAAETLDGPLVFYWHGTGGQPSEATTALGVARDEILAAGGIVVALSHDPAAGTFPWFLTTGGTNEADLDFADEALACAIQEIGVDTHRIHAIGFSAGALNVSQMVFRRASYVASAVTYSGGIIGMRAPASDAPDARSAVMALHGGENDRVVVAFKQTTIDFVNALRRGDHFGFICDHGMRHTIPSAARPFAWQFLQAHPYGMFPAAYASGLPEGFYAPCTLD